MKTKILTLLTIFVTALGLSSCHDDPNNGPVPVQNSTGKVNLRSMGIEVSNAENVIETTSSRTTIDLSDFIIEIYKTDGTKVKSWKYSEMPEVFELPVGSYEAKVFSHVLTKAEWEKPYFVGEAQFDIENEKVTDLGIVKCTLGNIKVSICYTDELRKLMGDDVCVTVIANDEGRLEFKHDETRSGYFAAVEGSSTIVAELNGTINGNFETLRTVIDDAAAGQHRIFKFKVKGGGDIEDDDTGTIDPTQGITLDVDVIDEDLTTNISIEEDILDPSDRPDGDEGDEPGPGPIDENTIRFESSTLSFDKPNSVDVEEAVVNIYAPKGIEHFMVSITSTNNDFIASAGQLLPLEFDLAYPGDSADDFKSLGFPVGDEVIGATFLKFEITGFVPLLDAFPGTHKFQLSVQDSDKKQLVKTLTFVAN